ncbi:GH19513 [Drosophila grimshawi]|uniref:GH19513 n=1 Tax=Drosophila grimshawi TaxID=7222 RepID=B4JGZ3_DROGR|nr:GH19513 [Drosophila grimshawi]
MATFQMETRQRTNLKQRAKPRQRQRFTYSGTDSQPQLEEEKEAVVDQIAATNCTRLWPTCASTAHSSSRRSSSSTTTTTTTSSTTTISTIVDCSSCQRALIMLSMLVVVIAVISGNGVLAAQRDSYKSKDVSSSNNAIPNEGDAAAAAAVNGVPGTGSMSSNTNINGNYTTSHVTATGSMTTDISSSSSSSTSSIPNSGSGSGVPATTTTTTISGIASGSLHKGNSIASLAAASGINRNSIDLIDDSRNSGPYFDRNASKNVTALLGKTAYLNCRVKNLGNKTMLLQVSWVRHRDIHLLTVGRYTYTSDQRFRAIHQPQTEDWMLQIKYPQHRDSGIYECQVSTTPHMSHYIHLTVVEPSTEIIGAPDLYIESGSTINLTCVILNSPEPPAYIFWNHNNAVSVSAHPAIINYDSPRGGVSVVTNKGDTTTSFLLIKSARPSDSGHYQCNPSNAKPKSVTVHVLNGVSHSVSRGVPSSNAARGTSPSSHVSASLSLSVPVCVLLQFGICQALHAALSGAAAAATSTLQFRLATTRGGSSNSNSSSSSSSSSSCRYILECILSLLSSLLSVAWHWRGRGPHQQQQQQLEQSATAAATANPTTTTTTAAVTFRQVYEADIR